MGGGWRGVKDGGRGVPSTAPRPCVNRAHGLHRGLRDVVPSARKLINLDQVRFSGDKPQCFLLMQPVSENSSSLLERISDSWTVPNVFPVPVYERFVWNGHWRKRSLEERGHEKEVTHRRREKENTRKKTGEKGHAQKTGEGGHEKEDRRKS